MGRAQAALLPVCSSGHVALCLHSRAAKKGGKAGRGAAAAAPPAACTSLRDMPSGLIGKLLVFKSGKVGVGWGQGGRWQRSFNLQLFRLAASRTHLQATL